MTRRTVIGSAVLVVLLVAALLLVEWRVTANAEQRITDEVSDAVGVPMTATIEGWPNAPGVLRGVIPRLSVAGQDVPVPDSDVVIDDLAVDLTDLQLQDETPVDGEGTFTAALSQDEVRSAAPPNLAGLVSLTDDALVLDAGLFSVPLQLRLDGQVLVVEFPTTGTSLEAIAELFGAEPQRVPLNPPDGVVVTHAEVQGGMLLLSGTLDPVQLSAEE